MFPKRLIIWEGKIDINNVTWELIDSKIKPFPDDLEVKRLNSWKSWIKKHPHEYDGLLVRLVDIKENKTKLKLSTNLIRYSQIRTLLKYKIRDHEWIGQLGIAMSVYDLNRTSILSGQRSELSTYRPLYYSLVGGIIEKKDLQNSLYDTCMRELKEEIDEKFSNPRIDLIAVIYNLEELGFQLIADVYTDLESSNKYVKANEEWQDYTLKWYSHKDLCLLKNEDMLHDIRYKISTICND